MNSLDGSLKLLKRNGMFDHTIVVFVSDHGDSMGMHENIGKNIFYEEAMRVPFYDFLGRQTLAKGRSGLIAFCGGFLSDYFVSDGIGGQDTFFCPDP